MNQKISDGNSRIIAVDVLRGLAVMAIILLHSIEHFNFYHFPKELPFEWFQFTDKVIWDGLFFAFAGKAYAIFALLFGFGFYIQYENQRKRGSDFRLRFMWRMVLLLLLGQLNAMFFTGEILTLYALIGVVLVLCCRLSNKVILILVTLLVLQPFDWARVFYALANPEYTPDVDMAWQYFGAAFKVQIGGDFIETAKVNIWEGQLASLTWALENGRITQTAALFLFGMYVGRRELFTHTEENQRLWLKSLGIALLCFFPLYGLYNVLPDFVERKALLQPLLLILGSLHKLSFMIILITGFLHVFYLSKTNNFLLKWAPYGKMSLSNYLGQSIIGSLLFYHWGFFLADKMGITYSFFIGIGLLILQIAFCTWWLKNHRFGPFEWVWRKLTWIGTSKK